MINFWWYQDIIFNIFEFVTFLQLFYFQIWPDSSKNDRLKDFTLGFHKKMKKDPISAKGNILKKDMQAGWI